MADPLHISLPPHPRYAMSLRRSCSILFRVVESSPDDTAIQSYPDQLFCKLFSLYEDLSIVEHIYCVSKAGFYSSTADCKQKPLLLPLPTRISLHRLRPSEAGQVDDLKDFIVSDDRMGNDVDEIGHRGGRSRCDALTDSTKRELRSSHDWQDVYAFLTDEDGSGSAAVCRRDVADSVGVLQQECSRARSPRTHLVSEILSGGLSITDIDDDSAQLENLVSTFNSLGNDETMLIRLPITWSARHGAIELASIYNTLLRTHLAPLSPHIPDRVRVKKERLARNCAADVFLASSAIRALPAKRDPSPPLNSIPASTASQLVTSSMPLSQPSSMITASTLLSQGSREEAVEDDPINPILTRLSIYTGTRSPPLQSNLSTDRNLSSLLRHLPSSSESNPASYSWQETERTIAIELEEEEALAAAARDPRARRKAEKAKAAKAKKEENRRLAAEELAKARDERLRVVTTGQATIDADRPGVVSDNRAVQSSQIAGADWHGSGVGGEPSSQHFVPMTQPEPGAFGARRAGQGTTSRDPKPKKRAAGF
jgi:hypothetical protein